jgi:hypothetical protein
MKVHLSLWLLFSPSLERHLLKLRHRQRSPRSKHSQRKRTLRQRRDSCVSAKLQLESDPDGADIANDGNFVGNTPSDVQVAEGEHTISVKKAGCKDWERTLKVSGGSSVHLDAELEKVVTP